MVRVRFLLVKLAQFDRKMSFHFPRVFPLASLGASRLQRVLCPFFGFLGGNFSGLGTRGSHLGLAGSINGLLLFRVDSSVSLTHHLIYERSGLICLVKKRQRIFVFGVLDLGFSEETHPEDFGP